MGLVRYYYFFDLFSVNVSLLLLMCMPINAGLLKREMKVFLSRVCFFFSIIDVGNKYA